MTTSQHKIDAIQSGSHPAFGEWEIPRVIFFTYTPGIRPTLDDPGSDPTIEFVKVSPGPDAPAESRATAARWLNSWAEGWLEEHQDEAIAAAIHDREAEADDHADYQRRARIDDQLTGEAFIR